MRGWHVDGLAVRPITGWWATPGSLSPRGGWLPAWRPHPAGGARRRARMKKIIHPNGPVSYVRARVTLSKSKVTD